MWLSSLFCYTFFFFISGQSKSTFEQHNVLISFPVSHPPLPTGIQNCSLPQMKIHYPLFSPPAALMTLQPWVHISYLSFSMTMENLSYGMAGVLMSHQCTQYLLFKVLVGISCSASQPQKNHSGSFSCLLRRQLFWVSS